MNKIKVIKHTLVSNIIITPLILVIYHLQVTNLSMSLLELAKIALITYVLTSPFLGLLLVFVDFYTDLFKYGKWVEGTVIKTEDIYQAVGGFKSGAARTNNTYHIKFKTDEGDLLQLRTTFKLYKALKTTKKTKVLLKGFWIKKMDK